MNSVLTPLQFSKIGLEEDTKAFMRAALRQKILDSFMMIIKAETKLAWVSQLSGF